MFNKKDDLTKELEQYYADREDHSSHTLEQEIGEAEEYKYHKNTGAKKSNTARAAVAVIVVIISVAVTIVALVISSVVKSGVSSAVSSTELAEEVPWSSPVAFLDEIDFGEDIYTGDTDLDEFIEDFYYSTRYDILESGYIENDMSYFYSEEDLTGNHGKKCVAAQFTVDYDPDKENEKEDVISALLCLQDILYGGQVERVTDVDVWEGDENRYFHFDSRYERYTYSDIEEMLS